MPNNVLLTTEGQPARPWQLFIKDMVAFIQAQQQLGDSIILCLDANESMESSKSQIKQLAV